MRKTHLPFGFLKRKGSVATPYLRARSGAGKDFVRQFFTPDNEIGVIETMLGKTQRQQQQKTQFKRYCLFAKGG